jgi:hypothetical protein
VFKLNVYISLVLSVSRDPNDPNDYLEYLEEVFKNKKGDGFVEDFACRII